MKNSKQSMKQSAFCLCLMLSLAILLTGLWSRQVLGAYTEGEPDPGNFEFTVSSIENQISECYDVSVHVKNKGQDLSATLQLLITFEQIPLQYETAVALPAGQTKEVTFSIPRKIVKEDDNPKRATEIKVVASGKTLGAARFTMEEVFADAENGFVNVGLLSDHPRRLGWMDYGGGAMLLSGNPRSIRLKELDVSFAEKELSSLRYLVIDDFDTASLKTSQMDAINTWLLSGGGLIIGTGARSETLDGFDLSFLDISILSKGNEETPFTAIEYGQSYITENAANEALLLKQMSHGAVMVFPFSMDILSDNPDIVRGLYETLATYTSGSIGMEDGSVPYYLVDAFNYMEKEVSLRFDLLRVLLLLYLFLVGPISYLVLKKMKKREMIWVGIPALALFFVLLVFLAGLRYRIMGMTMDSVTVADAEGSGNVHTYFNGYRSAVKDWSVPLAENYYAAIPIHTTYSYREQKPCVITSLTNGISVGYQPDRSFDSMGGLAYGANLEKGSLTFEDKPGVGLISGDLTNRTGHDLKLVLVVKNGYGYLFKDIADGQSVSTDDESHIQQRNVALSGSGADTVRILMSDYYQEGKKELSRYLAAIVIGAYDVWREDDRTYCIGVSEDDTQVFPSLKEDSNLTCLYSVK